MQNARFPKSERALSLTDRDRRRSFSNETFSNPSISGADQDYRYSSRRMQSPEIGVDKLITGKTSYIPKTPRLTPSKAFSTPRRQTEPPKTSYVRSKRDSVSLFWVSLSKSTVWSILVKLILHSYKIILLCMVLGNLQLNNGWSTILGLKITVHPNHLGRSSSVWTLSSLIRLHRWTLNKASVVIIHNVNNTKFWLTAATVPVKL